MPPIRSAKNQYRGINAHLHSYWQSEGGWDSFHSNHITYLTSALKAKLLPMGYTAETQQSLQIRRLGEPAGRPESDVTLSQYTAIGIYEFVPGQSDRGEPVAWIELLSPSNKPGGQDAAYYRNKRHKLLQSGMVFVELDYLHESPSTFERIPRYAGTGNGSDSGAHPYRIMVVDPRPVFLEGIVYPAEFDVDDPIPSVEIPLHADDVLSFDFNAPYQRTFDELFYGVELVDYSQLPLHWERYSRDDQIHILARMLAVMKGVRNGIDLEKSVPIPTKGDIALESALAAIRSWK